MVRFKKFLKIFSEGLNYIEQDKLILGKKKTKITKDATQKGIDIREHSKQIEDELNKVEEDSIADCKKKK
jgi:transposase